MFGIARQVLPNPLKSLTNLAGNASFTQVKNYRKTKPEQKLSSCNDEPIELSFNPYEEEPRKCILCKHQVKLDYKNSRLLQQFVSSFSGRVYDRHVTGLCNKQHDILLKTIAMSRKAGYMPVFTKDPQFLSDPKLFDPHKPMRPHSYA